MQTSPILRSLAFLVLGVSAPFLTQCKTGPGTYKDVKYDPSLLKTPSGHGLEKKEYPFDDDGTYRKDWVKNNTTGKTRSSSGMASTPSVASTEDSGSSAPTSYPTYAQASQARDAEVSGSIQSVDSTVSASGLVTPSGTMTSASIPVTPPTSATAVGTGPASYHTVVTGDTLFALAQRYQTSVDELQRVNGLTDASIQTGQSLRVP